MAVTLFLAMLLVLLAAAFVWLVFRIRRKERLLLGWRYHNKCSFCGHDLSGVPEVFVEHAMQSELLCPECGRADRRYSVFARPGASRRTR
ncbi:MAG: hypothetical protein DHS20C14_12330 [Phycisphaeraceae bacterium]|nr:MAG: hypothetical protein DHS20C14_12330 [Phycisphaeraceae bacterium]